MKDVQKLASFEEGNVPLFLIALNLQFGERLLTQSFLNNAATEGVLFKMSVRVSVPSFFILWHFRWLMGCAWVETSH